MKLAVPVSPRARPAAPIPLQGPLDWAFGEARAAGYQGVELQIGHPGEVAEWDVAQLLREHDLEAVCVATGAAHLEDGLWLADPIDSRRAKAVDRLREHIDLCESLGAALVIGMMRGKLSLNPGEAASQLAAYIESLRECLDAAAGRGVTLLVEPINRYETNFLATTQSVLDLLSDAGLSQIDLLLDTFHMNIEEVSIEAALSAAAGRIGLVQLVDSNRRAPGMGHLDVGSIISTLHADGYEGYLSVECLGYPSGVEAIAFAAKHIGKFATASQSI